MRFRELLALGFACLSLPGCSDEESAPPLPSAPSDVSTVVADGEWKAVIEDWYVDGTFNRPHRCVAIREAITHLPTSPREWSSVFEDMRRLERAACG